MTSPFLKRIRDTSCGNLAENLLTFAGRIPPTEAARSLLKCLGEVIDRNFEMATVGSMERLRPDISTVRAKKISPIASKIESDSYNIMANIYRDQLNHLMERMGQSGTTHVWKSAAEILAEVLKDPSSERHRSRWALRAIVGMELAAVARWLDRADRSRICRQPSDVLLDGLKRETNPIGRGALAESAAKLADRLEPSESTRICGSACQVLCEALRQETDPIGRDALLRGVAMLAGRMDRAEAGELCRRHCP